MSISATNIIDTQMRLNADKFTAGAKQANKAVDQLIRGNLSVQGGLSLVRGALLGAGGAAALTAAAFVGTAIATTVMVTKAIRVGEELHNMSLRTGESVEALSRLKFAAEQEDVSLGQVSQALRILSVRAVAASRGNKEAAASFQRLNIDVKDASGQIKSGTELLRDLGVAINKLPTGTERMAAATQLLGRSGAQLLPLIQNFDALNKEAERLGLTIGPAFAKDADEFGDVMGQIGSQLGRIGVAVAEALLPSLIDMAKFIREALIPAVNFFKDDFEELGFQLFRTGKLFDFVTAGAVAFGAKLSGDQATLAGAQELMREFAGALDKTREEWVALRNAESPAGPIGEAGAAAGTAAEQMQALADAFKDLDKEAIAPVVAVAKDLAGENGLGVLSKQFKALVVELQRVAQTSNAAKLALAEVFKVQQEGLRQIQVEKVKALGDAFKDLDKDAIAPLLQVARELAGENGIGALGTQFQALVTELQRVAQTSPIAAKALGEVLRIQQAALAARTFPEPGTLQGPVTEGGVGPLTPEQQAAVDEDPFGLERGAQGPVTAGGIGPERMVAAAEGAEGLAIGLRNAADAAAMVNGELATMESVGASIFNALNDASNVFVDSLITIGGSFEQAGQAAIDFFRELLLSFARAIVRGLILAAIMSAIGLGPGINIKKIVQGAAGAAAGGIGFQDEESSMLGRSAQARSLATGIGGGQLPGAASGLPVPNVTVTPTVQINQATPMTWARVVDENVMPRLRTRQRRLNDDLT